MEIDTGIIKTDYQTFLDMLSKFDEVRVAVPGGESPFEHVFILAQMSDVKHTVEQFKMDVTYSVMYNSKVKPEYTDNLYIHTMKTTLI